MNLENIQSELRRAGLPDAMKSDTIERIASYFELRSNWSQTHNVAGPQSMKTPWELDLPDAVAANEVLHGSLPLADVGTGSGTPGLIIACIRPDLRIFLVEPIAKRTAFLRMCVAKLALKNVRVLRNRWPCVVPEDTVQVISRAVVSPEEWPGLAASRENANDHIIRMLAAQRPSVTLTDYALQSHLEYSLGIHGERLVERWAPIADSD